MIPDYIMSIDITNKELIEKYAINIPEEVKDCVNFKEGELEILDKEKLFKIDIRNF